MLSAGRRRKSEVAGGQLVWDLIARGVTKTTKRMLSCRPQVPHSVIFLLMLLPSLLSTENFLYHNHDWKNYHGLGLDPRTFSHEDRNPRHMWRQVNSNYEACQATPDIYFVLDK